MKDQEYVDRYNELYALLERAYKDYYYLQAIGDIDDRIGYEAIATKPLSHICELLKTDLCLLIWKTCIDTASGANTLNRLKNDVYLDFRSIPRKNYFKNTDGKVVFNSQPISKMRSKAIAHSIMRREVDDVKIETLKSYLDEGIRLLNDICLKDKGVMPFDGAHMLKIRYWSEGGLRKLLRDGAVEKPKGYKVITLCGSTRFKDAFLETQKRLTLEGNIVISVGLFGHCGDDEVWAQGTKEMLDDMYKRKIDMADEVFVINVGGYIGESTRSEIDYAVATGKKVCYLEN